MTALQEHNALYIRAAPVAALVIAMPLAAQEAPAAAPIAAIVAPVTTQAVLRAGTPVALRLRPAQASSDRQVGF